jgi:hypothetical protein
MNRVFALATGLVASILVLTAGLSLSAGSAQAAWVPVDENGVPGHLSLRSDPYPASFLALSPGSVEHWQVAASLVDPIGSLSMRFERSGELVERPDGLQLQVQSCQTEWLDFPAAPHCPTAVTIFGPSPASSPSLGVSGPLDASSPVFPIGTIRHDTGRYLLVTMSIPDTPEARADESLMGLTATLGIELTASGDLTEPDPPGLADSGADAAAAGLLALGGLGLGGLGICVLLIRRRARERGTGS